MKILLVEDDIALSEALRFKLTKDGFVVDVCRDGRDALDMLLQDGYDMALLDRMLPTMNGLLVLKKARENGLDTPVIIITALGELYDRIEGLDAGADDYLVKPFEYEELSARIRSLGRRSKKYEDDSRLSFSDISYDCALRILSGPRGELTLSKKEGMLLENLLRSPNDVIRRMTLFARVWGVDAPVEEGNLDTYIHFIRRRLKNVGSGISLSTVRGVGYRLEDLRYV